MARGKSPWKPLSVQDFQHILNMIQAYHGLLTVEAAYGRYFVYSKHDVPILLLKIHKPYRREETEYFYNERELIW